MTDANLTRRRALLTGATLGGTAALLASRDVQAATPARKWDASYSGGSE
jgi:hypothetical protein